MTWGRRRLLRRTPRAEGIWTDLGPALMLACDGGNEARLDAGEVPVRAELLEALYGEVRMLRVCVKIRYG